MRAVFVSQVFHPDEQATSQLLSDLVVELSAKGIRCDVLAGFPTLTKQRMRCASNEQWRGVNIVRGGMRVDGKRSLPGRAISYASYCLWLLWRLLFFVPADARVLVVTNPPFAPALIYLCSWLRGWTYDVVLHDIYPDGLVVLGSVSDGAISVRIWRWFNQLTLRKAQKIVVLGRDMADLVSRHYEVPAIKIIYVPNWSPYVPREGGKAESTDLWKELRFEGKFVVQYSGNMGLWHDIEGIVRAADRLRDEPDICFLMIGEGRRRAAAERLSRDLGLVNICWLPLQSKERIPDTLATCHVALISQRGGLEGVAVPSKLYGILASGRAVLAQVPAQSEAAMVVREEECGLVIQPGDAQGLADAIKRLAKSRAEAEAMGTRAFAAYRAKYTLATAAARFEQVVTAPPAQ